MTTPLVCVVDASVAIKLYLAEALAAEAHALFAHLADPTTVFHAPDLFYVECANILWKQVQRGNATVAQASGHYAALSALPIQRTATFELAAEGLAVGTAQGITAYDACYVALGRRLGIPLITADQKLANKLAGSPYSVVWLGTWSPPTSSP